MDAIPTQAHAQAHKRKTRQPRGQEPGNQDSRKYQRISNLGRRGDKPNLAPLSKKAARETNVTPPSQPPLSFASWHKATDVHYKPSTIHHPPPLPTPTTLYACTVYLHNLPLHRIASHRIALHYIAFSFLPHSLAANPAPKRSQRLPLRCPYPPPFHSALFSCSPPFYQNNTNEKTHKTGAHTECTASSQTSDVKRYPRVAPPERHRRGGTGEEK